MAHRIGLLTRRVSVCGLSAEGDPETASVLSEGGVTHGQLVSVGRGVGGAGGSWGLHACWLK